MVCLPGSWERQASAGAELALCRQTPDGAVRSRQKAASHSLSLFFLFIYFLFYYIFVSYSLSAAGVDPLLLRGYLISKDNIFLEGVVR